MSRKTSDILFEAEATYKDLLLRKSGGLRILETAVFAAAMLVASVFFETRSPGFQAFAFASAFAVVGLSPFVYKVVLRPRYTLTKTHLIVSIAGKERAYPLNQVEPVWVGRHVYLLGGKRESLMVSREFLARLNERLQLFQRKR